MLHHRSRCSQDVAWGCRPLKDSLGSGSFSNVAKTQDSQDGTAVGKGLAYLHASLCSPALCPPHAVCVFSWSVQLPRARRKARYRLPPGLRCHSVTPKGSHRPELLTVGGWTPGTGNHWSFAAQLPHCLKPGANVSSGLKPGAGICRLTARVSP